MHGFVLNDSSARFLELAWSFLPSCAHVRLSHALAALARRCARACDPSSAHVPLSLVIAALARRCAPEGCALYRVPWSRSGRSNCGHVGMPCLSLALTRGFNATRFCSG